MLWQYLSFNVIFEVFIFSIYNIFFRILTDLLNSCVVFEYRTFLKRLKSIGLSSVSILCSPFHNQVQRACKQWKGQRS